MNIGNGNLYLETALPIAVLSQIVGDEKQKNNSCVLRPRFFLFLFFLAYKRPDIYLRALERTIALASLSTWQ